MYCGSVGDIIPEKTCFCTKMKGEKIKNLLKNGIKC